MFGEPTIDDRDARTAIHRDIEQILLVVVPDVPPSSSGIFIVWKCRARRVMCPYVLAVLERVPFDRHRAVPLIAGENRHAGEPRRLHARRRAQPIVQIAIEKRRAFVGVAAGAGASWCDEARA
jgi:hypothetical protein